MITYCGPYEDGWGPWPLDRDLDFTLCFMESVIVMIPKVFLFLVGAFQLYQLWGVQRTRTGFSVFYLISLFALIAVATTDFLVSIIHPSSGIFWIVGSLTTLLTFLFALGLHLVENFHRAHSSSVLLVFWIGLFIVELMKLRTMLLMRINNTSLWLLVVTLILIIPSFIFENIVRSKPIYETASEEKMKESPEESAGLFSVLTFWWMNPLMVLGYKKPLSMEDLWELNTYDQTSYLARKFEEAWNAEAARAKPSLFRAFARAYGFPFSVAMFFKLGQDLLGFVQPVLLAQMIYFVQSYSTETPQRIEVGYFLAVAMFFTAVVQTILLHQYFHRCFSTGMRIRAGTVTAVYRKALKLSNAARQHSTIGEIVNHMSVDAQRFMDLCGYLHMLWSGPLQIALALFFLYNTLGYSIFGGVFVMLLMIPVNTWLASLAKNQQVLQMNNKDTRTKMMDELLGGIKVIKLYAWEQSFLAKILEVRERELSTLVRLGYINIANVFLWTCSPFLVSLITFAVYVLVAEQPLTAEKAFVSLSLFNLLQFPLVMFPSVITSTVEASVALNRVHQFLTSEEIETNAISRSIEEGSPNDAIIMENATLSWDKTLPQSTLGNISFSCKKGSLVMVVGQVGAGKSSLLSALLGEMPKLAGIINVKGTIAYVPQQAWIMNSSLRNNITFSKPFDKRSYNKVLKACALKPDLKVLPAGDMTEIGEKGINLSGGQKQRVSLARAVYSNADVFLFDDPLSAVDAHVGKHIFENVFGKNGLLRGKTRLFVSNAIQFLPYADKIIVLKKGAISEMGSYSELINARSDFYQLISEYSGISVTEDSEGQNQPNNVDKSTQYQVLVEQQPISRGDLVLKPNSPLSPDILESDSESDLDKKTEEQPTEKSKLMSKEEQVTGSVSMDVYKSYAQSIGYFWVVFLLLTYTIGQAFQVGSSWWLSEWSQHNTDANSNQNVGLYLGVYTGLGLGQSFFTIFEAVCLYIICGIRSSRFLHDEFLKHIIRAPMYFFDTTPLGRILNRFSKDVYTIDEVLPRSFGQYFRTMFIVLAILFVITLSTPYFLVGVIPLGIMYLFVQRYYVATSREIKRLDSISRSPIYAHFSETLSGVSTIRAYELQHHFMDDNEKKLNENQKAYYPSIASNRWLATRLEFIGACVVFLSALFAVVTCRTIEAGIVGLSITYALSVTQTLNWMVRQSCEIETNIVSVERIKEYIEVVQEAPDVIEHNRPPKTWPEHGTITFKDYSTRYREGLDLVLKGVSCEIKNREKVGIVGRTGAGKSSITLALFRIIEAASGSIIIDSINIVDVGLFDLRSRITIIPQDPVLFAGTVRNNLDPFSHYSDFEIWQALESAHLKQYITSLPNLLNTVITQGGENMSVGQRQLICLARALLRKTKILVLDEATAAIDVETDDFIQKTIRTEFTDCTILTIAHRLNTVIDNDRILVLNQGTIQEFDTPSNLLSNQNSIFYGMAKEAGLIS